MEKFVYGNQFITPPITYGFLQGIMFFFPIAFDKARAVIRDEKIAPIKITPKHSLMGVTIFDFIDCPVGPYRELALTIPVSLKKLPIVPSLICLLAPERLADFFALYTLKLGMTTTSGREHASALFGYPVYANNISIEFEQSSSFTQGSVKEGDKVIFEFSRKFNRQFKNKRRYYNTIFLNRENINLVELSAVTTETSIFFDMKSNFVIGTNHPIAKFVTDFDPIFVSLQTTIYKQARETLSAPKLFV